MFVSKNFKCVWALFKMGIAGTAHEWSRWGGG